MKFVFEKIHVPNNHSFSLVIKKKVEDLLHCVATTSIEHD